MTIVKYFLILIAFSKESVLVIKDDEELLTIIVLTKIF